jgi:hypothetical protein
MPNTEPKCNIIPLKIKSKPCTILNRKPWKSSTTPATKSISHNTPHKTLPYIINQGPDPWPIITSIIPTRSNTLGCNPCLLLYDMYIIRITKISYAAMTPFDWRFIILFVISGGFILLCLCMIGYTSRLISRIQPAHEDGHVSPMP